MNARTSTCVAAMIAASIWAAAPAKAQDGPQAGAAATTADATVDPAQADLPTGLADIIVTAQRRSENLQKVPISVVAIPPTKLVDLKLENLQDLQFATPGLVFSRGINFSLVSIRGIGSFNTNPGLEPAVATYIDGAYLERGFGAVYDIIDPASVQVLRGAQGTLWGRNATGGAILITTADPTSTLGARLNVEAGNLDHRKAEGMLNLPLTDTLAARVAVRYRKDGGYVRNLTTGNKLGWGKQLVARGKLAFTPSTAFNAILSYQYDRGKQSIDPNVEVLPAVYCQLCSVSRYQYPRTDPFTTALNNVNGERGANDRSNFYNLRMTYTADSFNVSSTTAYRKTDNFTAGDFDFTEVSAFNLAQISGSKAFTQSVLLNSTLAGSINFAGGIDYLNDTSFGRLYLSNTDAFNFAGASATDDSVKTRSYSGFAEIRVTPTPELTVTAGGRYTRDERDALSSGVRYKANFNSFTPRLVIGYDAGPADLYVSYNRGFKSGGFAGTSVYLPEKVDSYEAGAKYLSPDRALRVNFAAFLYKYKDIQVTGVNQSNVGNIATANNAGSATGKGVELEVDYKPAPWFYVFGGVSWLDAAYDRFRNAQVQVPVFNAQGQPTGFGVGTEDLSGTRLPRAPRWSGNIGVTLRAPMTGGWIAEATPSLRYSSRFLFINGAGGPLRTDQQPPFAVMNLTARIFPEGGNFEVNAFASNLGNKTYDQYRFSTAPFGSYRIVAQPRTYGIGLTFKM